MRARKRTLSRSIPEYRPAESDALGNDLFLATLGGIFFGAGVNSSGHVSLVLIVLGLILMLPALNYARRRLSARLPSNYTVPVVSVFVIGMSFLTVMAFMLSLGQASYLIRYESFFLQSRWWDIQFKVYPDDRLQYILVMVLGLVIAIKVVIAARDMEWRLVATTVIAGVIAFYGSAMLIIGSQKVHGCFYFNGSDQCSAFWTTAESRAGFSLLGVFALLMAVLICVFGLRILSQMNIRSDGLTIALSVLFLVAVSQLVAPPGIWRSIANYAFDGNISPPDLINAPIEKPELLWSVPSGSERVYAGPLISDGVLYVAGWNLDGSGTLVALESATGQERWRLETSAIHRDPLLHEGKVYVCSGPNVLAVDARTGGIDWEFETYGGICSGPVEWMGLIYVADQRGYVYAIDAGTGEASWIGRTTSARGRSELAVANGMLFVARTGTDQDGEAVGTMMTLDGTSGDAWLRTPLDEVVELELVSSGGKVFAVDGIGRVHVLDPTVEGIESSSKLIFGESQQFAAVEGTVLVPSKEGYLISYNTITETVNWKSGNGNSEFLTRPKVVGDLVLIVNWDTSELWAISLQTGELHWSVDLGPEMRCWSDIEVQAGVVFLGCHDGTVRAFGSPTTITPSLATPIVDDD